MPPVAMVLTDVKYAAGRIVGQICIFLQLIWFILWDVLKCLSFEGIKIKIPWPIWMTGSCTNSACVSPVTRTSSPATATACWCILWWFNIDFFGKSMILLWEHRILRFKLCYLQLLWSIVCETDHKVRAKGNWQKYIVVVKHGVALNI